MASAQTSALPSKRLPLPGEVFLVEGRTAFLLLPEQPGSGPMPWVLYAPCLPGLPSEAENWMFERFLAAGIAIAGVDVGESYGSPEGRRVYSALHDYLVRQYGVAQRACLLARSRGGLMLYNWAVENANSVACLAGIYPVCNLVSYPGLKKACAAYGMTEERLAEVLPQHNPIDRLAALAKAGVPILHLHGDRDGTVPLAQNSGELHRRYVALEGSMRLITMEGRGHDMWRGWFESRELVEFIIANARAPRNEEEPGTTLGIIDIRDGRRPVAAVQLVGEQSSEFVPENTDGKTGWSFAGGVLSASAGWDSVLTKGQYRDFRMHLEFNCNQSESPDAEKKGNSGVYIQQRYELQILDSFGVSHDEYKASFCGSLYRLKKPDRLVSRRAGEWQSFDIAFRAARYEGEEKVELARITAYQNQSLIHDDFEIPRKTGAGQEEGPDSKPIKLQGHQNRVRFRNVWIERLDLDGPLSEPKPERK
ncbi:MAG: hypothetical protein ACI9F9_002083 [Candidatus Paceibacteria bacterium]|jgi:hypothetical protein